MLRLVYSILFYLAVPGVLLRLLWRSRREPLYRQTIGERFGYVHELDESGLIWVHSVSAGETNAAAPLVNRLLDAGRKVIITTMTPTGRQRVRTLFGDRVFHTYAPYDMPGAVKRFLSRTRPATLVIIDTELWPNMIRYAHESGVETYLVNARLSEKSFRGYKRVAPLVKSALEALDMVAVQAEAHAARFRALGLAAEKVWVAGSIKFDVSLPADLAERTAMLREKVGERRIFLAASTHAGEDEIVLAEFMPLAKPEELLILAPRHPHRTMDVEKLCLDRGLTVVRHSSGRPCDDRTQVLLLDTMGELMYFYNIADVALVGGSLVPVGGHNPMEPASLSVPVIMGPYLRNIEDIAALFIEAGGMMIIDNGKKLGTVVRLLLDDEDQRSAQIRNANRVMAENAGALDRVLALVLHEPAEAPATAGK